MGWPYEAPIPPLEPMKPNALLTITSLLSILLMSLHVTDDIIRGISPARADNIGAVVIFVVWLLGTLLLAERLPGYIIMLLGGIFAAAMPVLHMRGARYGAIAQSNGGFFFVWTLIAVGVTGTFAVILSMRALWRLRPAKPR
jgi:MFS superfamily sulfate permease-like transporter